MASSHSCSICTHTSGAHGGVQTLECGEAACCSQQGATEFTALASFSQVVSATVRMHIERWGPASLVANTALTKPPGVFYSACEAVPEGCLAAQATPLHQVHPDLAAAVRSMPHLQNS